VTVATNAILAPYGWTDELEDALIDLCQTNGRVFDSLPDDGSRFEFIELLFDDAHMFYGILKLEKSYQFKCLKRACNDCLASGRALKFNAIPVDAESLRFWREKLPVNMPDGAICH
jgi:hypothetical protein